MRLPRLFNACVAGLFVACTPISPVWDDASAEGPAEPTASDAVLRIAQGAHESLMKGEIATYRRYISLSEDFSFMGPFGGNTGAGASYSDAQWAAIARSFQGGRDAHFELIHAYHVPGLAVLAGIERANVAVGGLPAQNWSLRVTLVFKHTQAGWRLAHRHADPLVKPISLTESAALADESR